jgi:hypothetical protein
VGVTGGQQVVQKSVQRSVVQQTVQLLASDLSAVNETAFRHHMASVYGVPVEAISLELTKQEQALKEWEDAIEEEGERRRQLAARPVRALQSANLRLTYTLRIDPTVSNVSASDLSTSLQAASAGIASSLGAVLGVNVTQATVPATSTTTQLVLTTQDCQPGYYGNDNRCIICSPGTFDLGGRITACTRCVGAFQPGSGGTACHSCELGSYCPIGAAAALPCQSGRYSSATNLSLPDQCSACHRGSSCITGSHEPLLCAAGSVQAEEGRSSCKYCTPGHFQSVRGSVSCDKCPNRTYASISGAAQCNNCLARTSSYPGSTECAICGVGFYRLDATTLATPTACGPCPEKGATCPVDTTLETILVQPGHWRLSGWSREITECDGDNAAERCVGGANASSENSSVVGDGYCNGLYTGPECKLCRGGKGLYLDKGKCKKCPDFRDRMALLLGFATIIIVVAIVAFAAFRHPACQQLSIVRSARYNVSWVGTYATGIGFQAKLKVNREFQSYPAPSMPSHPSELCDNEPALLIKKLGLPCL